MRRTKIPNSTIQRVGISVSFQHNGLPLKPRKTTTLTKKKKKVSELKGSRLCMVWAILTMPSAVLVIHSCVHQMLEWLIELQWDQRWGERRSYSNSSNCWLLQDNVTRILVIHARTKWQGGIIVWNHSSHFHLSPRVFDASWAGGAAMPC